MKNTLLDSLPSLILLLLGGLFGLALILTLIVELPAAVGHALLTYDHWLRPYGPVKLGRLLVVLSGLAVALVCYMKREAISDYLR